MPYRRTETVAIHRLLVESIRDIAVYGVDPAGNVLSWNQGAQRFTGYAPDEVIGRHHSIFYTPDDIAQGRPDRDLATAAAEGPREVSGDRVRKDGSRFRTTTLITPLRDERGELVGFGKYVREQPPGLSEHALRQSEERFRLLVQSVRDYGIFMLDPDGRIASWNEGAERIKGYRAEEIIGRHFSIFYPPEDLAWDKPAMELRVASRDGRFEDEGWRLRKDGTRFWANVVITALRDHDDELVGFAKVTRDLTERRAAEQRAVEDARRLAEVEAANRAKAGFLAAMSHELRTPLNAIAGYIDLLAMGLRGPITEQQATDLERMRTSQRYLLGIINDLLNFSRIEAGRLTYDVRPVALREVLETVQPMIEPQASAQNLDLTWPDAPREWVNADAAKLEQILLNLLSNAVKFTPPGGHIGVRIEAHDERVDIVVSDTGVGIGPEELESIFEPFVQIGRSLSVPGEGAGLGLAISRELARAMDGDLSAESTPGEGSRFTLTLSRVHHA